MTPYITLKWILNLIYTEVRFPHRVDAFDTNFGDMSDQRLVCIKRDVEVQDYMYNVYSLYIYLHIYVSSSFIK